MKTILFRPRRHDCYCWQPYTFGGCLGRTLLFLLLLIVLVLLLSLFRRCQHAPGDDSTAQNDSTTTTQGAGAAGDDIVAWREPIPGGEEVGLPAPRDNVLPPFGDAVPNPDNGGATEIYPNVLYVIFDSDADDNTFKRFAQQFSSHYPPPQHKITYYNTGAKTAVLTVPEERRAAICQQLPQQISDVQFLVVPVEVMADYASHRPNDPFFRDDDKSWYFAPIQVFEAWGITSGSRDVIVGIVDSYMDLTHDELKGDRYIYPYSVIKNNADVAPEANVAPEAAGHGTFVTAVAVGNSNNGKGAAGIAPGCRFIPVSLGEQPNTITEVEGLLYCMYHGATVINISCGTSFTQMAQGMSLADQIAFAQEYGKPQEQMWDYVFSLAEKRNVTIVWAAGNDNLFTAMDTSKRNDNTIRVSAVDRQLHKATFSNYGNFASRGLYECTISAPGVAIWGALPGNKYVEWDGTSFSAPIITGVVALIKSQNKDLTTKQIISILQTTGKAVDGAPEIGKLVQINDALLSARATVAAGQPTQQ